MKNLAYALAGLGAFIALFAFAYDTAPEGTHNIGLIQNQTMYLVLGAVLLVAGSIVGSVAHALSRMEDAGLLPPAGSKTIVSTSQPSDDGVDV